MITKTGSKKKVLVKKVIKKVEPKKNPNIEKALIENFIGLQKVMTNFAMKFDNLANQISKLLELFEISAQTLAKKDISLDKGQIDPKMANKLDSLLDQNKIIARSLTLLHGATEPTLSPQLMGQPVPSQAPPQRLQPSPVKQTAIPNGYQKSILIKNQSSQNPKYIK